MTKLRLEDARLRSLPVAVSVGDSRALVVYEDGDVMYICKAPVGRSKSEAVWQIKKVDMSSGVTITWADGNDSYDNIATDLTTVKGLTYI